MKEQPPSNVPNQGSVELQLLAIQKELAFFKSYYVEMNKKLNDMHALIGDIEHFKLFTKVVKLFDDHLSNRWGDD